MFKLLVTLGISLILLLVAPSNPQVIAKLTQDCETRQGTAYLGPFGEWAFCVGRSLKARAVGQIGISMCFSRGTVIYGGHRTVGMKRTLAIAKGAAVKVNVNGNNTFAKSSTARQIQKGRFTVVRNYDRTDDCLICAGHQGIFGGKCVVVRRSESIVRY